MIRQLNTQSSMTTAVAAFLLVAAAIWGSTEALSDAAIDCCLTISQIKIPKQIAASYIVQSRNNGCPTAATVFITKKGKKLCSPPKEDYKWIADLIKYLDNHAEKKAQKNAK